MAAAAANTQADDLIFAQSKSDCFPVKKTTPDPRPSLEALYSRPGYLLRRAHQIGASLFLKEAADAGVTTTQYGVLVILRACEGLDLIGLAKKVGLDRTTTAVVVRTLEQKALAIRVADPQDRRRRVVVLTARGERMIGRLRAPAERARHKALSVFSPEDAAAFLMLLGKLVDRFNDETRAPIPSEPE